MNSNYTNDNALTILRDNITRLVNDERNHTSMRNLSVAIERDESYIQKFLDGKFIPSLDAIIDIANFLICLFMNFSSILLQELFLKRPSSIVCL